MPVDDQLVKAQIAATEGDTTPITVYFNPKEIQIDKQVPWKTHDKTEGNEPTLEFTSAQPKELTVELMFDGFEDETDVYQEYISKLEKLTMVDDDKKRPPNCTFTWGSAMPVFKGVIESLGVTYQLFMPDGTPVRAKVSLKMKQAEKLLNKKEAEEANKNKKAASKGVQTNASNSRRTDQVAASNGTNHRDMCSASGVDDPDNVPPGTTMRTGGGR